MTRLLIYERLLSHYRLFQVVVKADDSSFRAAGLCTVCVVYWLAYFPEPKVQGTGLLSSNNPEEQIYLFMPS